MVAALPLRMQRSIQDVRTASLSIFATLPINCCKQVGARGLCR